MVQVIRKEKRAKNPNIFELEIEPIEYNPRAVKNRVAIFDTETDPFAAGRVIKPFTCGIYFPDTDEYFDFWGEDGECIDLFITWLNKNFEPNSLSIFVHNGGNFDFYFMLKYFDAGHSPFIINGRLVRVMIQGQEFRDSYAMIPVPLGSYDKIKIDYSIMEKDNRDANRDEILKYQKRDCTALGELVTSWLDMFGDKLTMASVALPMLRSFHGFETIGERSDNDLRPFYFGGRNQCFTTGIHHGNFKLYDINSSYGNVMKRYQHPISDVPIYGTKIKDNTYFAYITAWSLGSLPVRKKDGGLDFPIGTFDFYACIHEIKVGLETGTIRIIKVHYTIDFDQSTCFDSFIDHFYNLRLDARASGDAIRTLFYKLVMNSSYGKFAQDPRKYENYLFNPDNIPTPFYCNTCYDAISKKTAKEPCELCDGDNPTHSAFGWSLHTQANGIMIYCAPQKIRNNSFFNVATAASITSAARAELLRGIKAATRPMYCDTDSLICEGLEAGNGLVISDTELGGWKCEAKGSTVAIAGKKLYAVWDSDTDNGDLGECIKKASKGVTLTADEIMRVCNGEIVEHANPVPKFTLGVDIINGDITDKERAKLFTTRRIRMTT